MNYQPKIEPEALSVADACAFASIGKTTLHRLIKEGKVKPRQLYGKTLIIRSEFAAVLSNLPGEAA
jgi:predicted site-specific integrase-resolvase